MSEFNSDDSELFLHIFEGLVVAIAAFFFPVGKVDDETVIEARQPRLSNDLIISLMYMFVK